MPIRNILLVCLCLSLSQAAWAEVLEIPYTRHVLDNGLTLIVHEDDKAPVVAVNIWYHVGSKNEEPGRTGFAHLFEHLMFQGSENYDDEYLLFLQQLGATNLNATTWFDRTNYFETIPKNALDTVLWLESDRMGHFAGAITQAKLDEQRGVVQNEKRQSDNQPYGKVWADMLLKLFPDGHPYSWETIGSMEDLNAATIEDVREWFATYYGPNNAVLSIAGDVNTEEVIQKVEKYFGDIPPGPPLAKPREWIPQHTSERRRTIEDRVPQARLYKAWTGPRWGTAEATQLAMATRILASGKNSRLYKKLAYEDRSVTDISMAPLALEIAGITYLAASAQPGYSLSDIEDTIKVELERFARKGPTKAEIERVRTQMKASFLRGIEEVGGSYGKAGILAQNEVYGGSPELYKEYLNTIDSATAKDLQTVARKWLAENAYIVEVQPFPELKASSVAADRSAPPQPGPAPDVGFPSFTRTTLENGLEVIAIERNDVPLVTMSMLFDAGYAADQFAKPGTAALAMAMLDEGTRRRSALEISEELGRLGAELSAGSDLDNSSVTLDALTDNLDASLELMADVILNPAFPEQDLERLRLITLSRIQQEKNRPVSMALRVMPGLLYGPDHAYSQPLTGSGTIDSVNEITQQDLQNFHQQWLKPNNATLIVVGDIQLEELTEKLNQLFGDWEPGNVPKKNLDVANRASGSALYLVDRPDAEQSVIFAGQLLPPRANPDELALQAMNNILGGLSSARINMNLREDKGWSYGAYSTIVGARGERPLLIYAPVQTDKTSDSIEQINAEVSSFIADLPATADELNIVKRSKTLSLPGRWETNADLARALDDIVSDGLPDDYWTNYAANLNRLSLEDTQRAASAYLQPEEIIWVVVGDRDKIEADLLAAGFDEIRRVDADGQVIEDAN